MALKNQHVWNANRAMQPTVMHFKLYIHFTTFKQPKCHIKMAALMLPLQKEATIEKKTNTCKVQHHPTYHWRLQIIQDNLESCIKMHHNKDGKEVTGKSQIGRGHWGRHMLQSQWTLNLKLTWVWQWCPISFKTSNGINTGLSKRDSTVRAQHHNSEFLWLICSSYSFFVFLFF